MVIWFVRFKSKYTSRGMQMWSFRLNEIKKILADYEPHVIYDIDEETHDARITFSETFPDELNAEISNKISEYYRRSHNQLHSYHDIAKEMEYTNGEG